MSGRLFTAFPTSRGGVVYACCARCGYQGERLGFADELDLSDPASKPAREV